MQFLAVLFVIYANVVEKRGKLNDFGMWTLSRAQSDLGSSE